MAVRALVIAIENYPVVQVGGIAKQLPGTLKAGLDFKAWLLAKWNSGGRTDTQLIFCSDPVQPNGMGATADDIRAALLKLKADGQSATEELYFFFSGHGFSFATCRLMRCRATPSTFPSRSTVPSPTPTSISGWR
jgi:hypothetical protein